MVDRTKKQLLLLVSLACVACSVAVLSASATLPLQIARDEITVQRADRLPRTETSNRRIITEEQFQYVWRKRLQGPLVDPQPEVKTAKKEPEKVIKNPVVRLEARLIGTLVDDDPAHARAWIEVNGKPSVYSTGQKIEGHGGDPIVRSIGDRQVVILLGDVEHAIRIEPGDGLKQWVESAGDEDRE